jgi:N-acetylneuraminic acid mutarotase
LPEAEKKNMTKLFEMTQRFALRNWSIVLIFVIVLMTAGFQKGCPIKTPDNIPVIDGSFDPRFHPPGMASNLPYPPNIVASVVDQRTGQTFIGGAFTTIYDEVAFNIAATDAITNQWSRLSGLGLKTNNSGPEIVVRAMVISGNYLYVGGKFSDSADGVTTNLNNIARYDIDAGTWSTLAGSGLNGPVNALAIEGESLLVGGVFSQTFDGAATNLNNLARYNLTKGEWLPFNGNGLNGSVYALAVSQGDLYVGGSFSQTFDGATTNLNNIAYFTLSNGVAAPLNDNGVNGNVYALAFSPTGNLFVGGAFTQTFAGGVINLNRIASYRLDSNQWSALDSNGLNGEVYALAADQFFLFVGGQFTQNNGGTILNHVARYAVDNENWAQLPAEGLNQNVYTLTVAQNPANTRLNILYAGGRFARTFNGNISLYGIVGYGFQSILAPANLGTQTMSLLKPGLGNGIALNRDVRALAGDATGKIYAGGYFSETADGATANLNSIARFDPVAGSWAPTAHNGLNSSVEALAISGDNLYVGGAFSATADGVATNLNRIARYNLTTGTWSPLAGGGLNGFVNALAILGDNLYVAGSFTRTFDGTTTNLFRIARYNLTTNTWSPLDGNGLNSDAYALAISGDDLYVGGSFSRTFDGSVTNLNRIARYNTVTNNWSELTDLGLNSNVYALTASDGNLFVRGEFSGTFNTGATLNRLARYNTADNTWSAITGKADAYRAAIITGAAVRSGNELFLGGSFTGLDSGVARYLTRIYLQQWKVPASTTDWFDDLNWTTGSVPAFNTSAVIPAGAGEIAITSADVTLNDLMFNGGTLTIGAGRTLTINGILGLKGGTISGAGTLIMTNCQPDAISGGGAAAYIQTALVRCANNSETMNFPVGTANGYSPVTVKNISGAGNILIKANQGAYPHPASGLPVNRLARWWQIENPGGGITGGDLHFGYLQSDVAGIEANNKAYRITGGTALMIDSSVNSFANRLTSVGVTGFSDWTLANAAPTAASVALGGRVLNSVGGGISRTSVSLTNLNGETRTVLTNSFGIFRFDAVRAGESYVISVQHKKIQFNPPALLINATEDALGINFSSEN